MSADQEMPASWTHSLKVEDTAKGVRLSVHVYATDRLTAVTEAFNLYDAAKIECERRKIVLAPVEVKGGKAE